ncbi:MAG: class III signal peptide-containing protein [Candidatus Micrarchaeia archaeon]|jgi:uncharacterized protein (UPF0333 family)
MASSSKKGQVSIELIIIIAAVLAVALILVTQLQKTASTGSDIMGKESNSTLDKVATMIDCTPQTEARDCPSDYLCNSNGKCERKS